MSSETFMPPVPASPGWHRGLYDGVWRDLWVVELEDFGTMFWVDPTTGAGRPLPEIEWAIERQPMDDVSERTATLLAVCKQRWAAMTDAATSSLVTGPCLMLSLPHGSDPDFATLHRALSRYEQAVGAAVASIRQDYADAKSEAAASADFETLRKQWHEETRLLSDSTKMVLHPAYQRIIGLGPAVVPHILASLLVEPDHWDWALRAITGEDPVPDGCDGDIVAIAEAWLSWGRQRGLIRAE